MPQMAPLSWLSLYVIFTITLILFCMMNYFIFIPSAPKISGAEKSATHVMTWKW